MRCWLDRCRARRGPYAYGSVASSGSSAVGPAIRGARLGGREPARLQFGTRPIEPPMPATAVFFHEAVSGAGRPRSHQRCSIYVRFRGRASIRIGPAAGGCAVVRIDDGVHDRYPPRFREPSVFFFGPLPVCVRPLGTSGPTCDVARGVVTRALDAPISCVVIGSGIRRLCSDVRRLSRRRS